MPLPSRYWQDLPWTAFRTLPADAVAVLPVAAIEQHGPHLPVSVDTTINQGLVARTLTKLADDMPVLVLPTQAVGLSVEHIRFPGTLTGSPESLLALWTEIGESVARAGVRRLVILNTHGGQPQLGDLLCMRLRGRARMFAVNCFWSRLGRPEGLDDPGGLHGGLIETSLMLHLAPERVDRTRAANFRSAWLDHEAAFPMLRPQGPIGFGWETQDLHPAGALGDASRASAEIGARVLDFAATRLAALLEEVRRFDVDAWLRDDQAGKP
ncbi:MAG TPA: creatininase family protein [Acetobacteraceae bacterium]|nr:creatininase family protein [Acetobacteraceae bacterium]